MQDLQVQPQSNLTDSKIPQPSLSILMQFKSWWRASTYATIAFENIPIVQHLLTKSDVEEVNWTTDGRVELRLLVASQPTNYLVVVLVCLPVAPRWINFLYSSFLRLYYSSPLQYTIGH